MNKNGKMVLTFDLEDAVNSEHHDTSVADQLRSIAFHVELGYRDGEVTDNNCNKVGTWSLTA